MHWFCAAKWVLSPAMIKGTRNGIEIEITPKGDGNPSNGCAMAAQRKH